MAKRKSAMGARMKIRTNTKATPDLSTQYSLSSFTNITLHYPQALIGPLPLRNDVDLLAHNHDPMPMFLVPPSSPPPCRALWNRPGIIHFTRHASTNRGHRSAG